MTGASGQEHWDRAYAERGPTGVSWYQPSAGVSLELVEALGVPRDDPVIDVGGGASPLAGELLARGYVDVSVLDVSAAALQEAQRRLGERVSRLHEDVLRWRPTRRYGLWHDRAVLHFFTDPVDTEAYVRTLDAAVAPGGAVVLGTFAPEAPPRCSGLPVRRYASADLVELLGDDYEAQLDRYEVHVTPRGGRQPFTWVAFRRRAPQAPPPNSARSSGAA